MVSKAGFSNSGGATVVRKEGRGCAIIKSMKSPIPEKGTSGMLSELFNDSFKVSSGAAGVARLTIEEALSVAEPAAVNESPLVAEVMAVQEAVVEAVVAVAEAVKDITDEAPSSDK